MTASDPERECEICRVDSPDTDRARAFFAAVDQEEREAHEHWMNSFFPAEDTNRQGQR